MFSVKIIITLKQWRLSVLNETLTNCYTGPRPSPLVFDDQHWCNVLSCSKVQNEVILLVKMLSNY